MLAELELQSLASRIAELGRRRRVDLEAYERYVQGAAERFRVRVPALGIESHSPSSALERLLSGDCTVSVLASFADAYAGGEYPNLAGHVTAEQLTSVANALEEADCGRDITTDNDPREHGAHASWRRPSRDLTPRSSEPVHAVAHLALADEAPALLESITRMVAGLFVVVVGIGVFLDGGFGWLSELPWNDGSGFGEVSSQADALVAGSPAPCARPDARSMELPSTNTVLGQIRWSQRALATLSVAVTTALAMAVASTNDAVALTDAFILATLALLGLLALCVCELLFRRYRRRERLPRSTRLPPWVAQSIASRLEDHHGVPPFPHPRRDEGGPFAPDAAFVRSQS